MKNDLTISILLLTNVFYGIMLIQNKNRIIDLTKSQSYANEVITENRQWISKLNELDSIQTDRIITLINIENEKTNQIQR